MATKKKKTKQKTKKKQENGHVTIVTLREFHLQADRESRKILNCLNSIFINSNKIIENITLFKIQS